MGSDIFFARDQYNPYTKEGIELITHEITHVIQQDGKTPFVQLDKDTEKEKRTIGFFEIIPDEEWLFRNEFDTSVPMVEKEKFKPFGEYINYPDGKRYYYQFSRHESVTFDMENRVITYVDGTNFYKFDKSGKIVKIYILPDLLGLRTLGRSITFDIKDGKYLSLASSLLFAYGGRGRLGPTLHLRSRTFSGFVSELKTLMGGNPTIFKNGEPLFRIRPNRHGHDIPTKTPIIKQVNPFNNKEFYKQGRVQILDKSDMKKIYKAIIKQDGFELKTRGDIQ